MAKERALIADYHIVLFLYIAEKYRLELDEQKNRATDEIVRFYTNTFEHLSGTHDIEAIGFIEGLQNRLENAMKCIISTKCVYYWFHVYRRIAPVAAYNGESSSTIWLYRNILETAFQKYGKHITEEELIFSTDRRKVNAKSIANGLYLEALTHYKIDCIISDKLNGIYLGEFGIKEMIEIYSLERLAYEYWHTTSCARRLYKGGVLRIGSNQYWVENDPDTEFLMRSYDTRGTDLESLSGSDGISLYSENLTSGVEFVPKYNIEQLTLQEYPVHELFKMNIEEEMVLEFKPNFIWVPINFDHYYESHEFYCSAFIREFGYSLASFVYTLSLLLFRELIFSIENMAGLDSLKRAYRHFRSYDKLAEELMEIYTAGRVQFKYLSTLSKDEVIKALSDLTLPKETKHISLVTLGPRYLISPTVNNDFIIDYTAIFPLLMTKMNFLKVKEETKGHHFEDVMIERLSKKKIELWECKKKLRHADGSEKEIDISYIYKGFLFIGELKSNKMSLSFIKGDYRSLQYRKKKMREALKEADEKAEWLKGHTVGTNYRIPTEVNAIVPFVVSPFTEYIWNRSDNMWLTESIPRICNPSECESLCCDDVINSAATKAFTVFIARVE